MTKKDNSIPKAKKYFKPLTTANAKTLARSALTYAAEFAAMCWECHSAKTIETEFTIWFSEKGTELLTGDAKNLWDYSQGLHVPDSAVDEDGLLVELILSIDNDRHIQCMHNHIQAYIEFQLLGGSPHPNPIAEQFNSFFYNIQNVESYLQDGAYLADEWDEDVDVGKSEEQKQVDEQLQEASDCLASITDTWGLLRHLQLDDIICDYCKLVCIPIGCTYVHILSNICNY